MYICRARLTLCRLLPDTAPYAHFIWQCCRVAAEFRGAGETSEGPEGREAPGAPKRQFRGFRPRLCALAAPRPVRNRTSLVQYERRLRAATNYYCCCYCSCCRGCCYRCGCGCCYRCSWEGGRVCAQAQEEGAWTWAWIRAWAWT